MLSLIYIYIYNRFDQQSPKDVSIKELHEEVKQYKKEIKELRQFISLGLSDLQDQINRIDNQGIRTKLFDKEILFKFANPVENITLCDQEINLVGIDVPPKIIGTQLIKISLKKIF